MMKMNEADPELFMGKVLGLSFQIMGKLSD